jgi:hypothetical protein
VIVCEDSDVFVIRFTGGHFQYCWYYDIIVERSVLVGMDLAR